MLRIPCPWCGERDEGEFICGGPKKARRPEDASQMSEENWIAYLTVAPNPRGPMVEKWCHWRGCGRWFTLTRDTLTHAIGPAPDER